MVVTRSIVPPDALAYGADNLALDARFVNPERGDLRLAPGSPAIGSGQYGQDRGAGVPHGVVISGQPKAVDALDHVALAVAGPGFINYRYRVNQGAWSDVRPINAPVDLTALVDGSYQLELIGQDSAGQWQSIENATRSNTWTIDHQFFGLQINEVLAANDGAVQWAGEYPDLIELFNAGATTVDLSGMSLTDDPRLPRRFVFPAGVQIEPGAFLVLSSAPPSADNPWAFDFGLNRNGEGVYLYDAPARGGRELDALEYGIQSANLSLSHIGPEGQWQLSQPTFGSINQAQPLGDPYQLRINEWLTRGDIRVNDDYVELYNADSLPIDVSGLTITDDPVSRPTRYAIPAYSFVAAQGYVVFHADRNVDQGADHLPFRLAADQGHLAVLNSAGQVIDQGLYGWQTIDVSQGRYPDGGQRLSFQRIPSPGSANHVTEQQRTEIVALDATWRFDPSGAEPSPGWQQLGFDDATWQQGTGVFAAEEGGLPATVHTTLPLGQLAYYFRQSFTLDDVRSWQQLQLTTLIDDGAVLYLNGIEFLRLGIPAGPTSATTAANRGIGNAALEGPFEVPLELLHDGNNVLAVEVHQISRGNSDVVFGVMLEAWQAQSDSQFDQALDLLEGLRITEIMYHPVNNEALEFIELANVSQRPLDLTGVRLDGAIQFSFVAASLDPGQRVVVARDLAAFRAKYGMSVEVAGQYSGNLSNDSDGLTLLLPAPLDVGILRFDYDDTWYPRTDGEGFSLTRNELDAPAAAWGQSDQWRRSRETGGTPGGDDQANGDLNQDAHSDLTDLQLLCDAVRLTTTDDRYDLDINDVVDVQDVAWWLAWIGNSVVGDADLNGVFDSADLVRVFQTGGYERPNAGPATWETGDWNCDGSFSSSDLVAAFQRGGYQ